MLVAMLAVGCAGQAPPPSIAVGASSDPESQVLAHLYVAALRFYGNAAHVQEAQDPLRGLDSGDITVAPVFTGRLLHRLDPQSPARSEVQVYRTLLSSLPEGIAAGDYTISAQDEPALLHRILLDAIPVYTEKGVKNVTILKRDCWSLATAGFSTSRSLT